jgi:outer membrane protein OmpA-like peptidoglycan-associated protein
MSGAAFLFDGRIVNWSDSGVIRLGLAMKRAVPLCLLALLLAGCADDVMDHDNGRWLVTNRSGETDYELSGQVLFPSGSADLSPRAYDIVAKVADDAKRRGKARIEVEGFTDTTGTRDDNINLSQARADRVADVLVRHGINPKRIKARGLGESDPVIRTGDGVSEPRNRRVVIRLIG